MRTKMIKKYGIIGRQAAFEAVKNGGEAIWRPRKGAYARALNMGGISTYSDIPGDYWATATLTIAKWFERYAQD